MKKKILIVVSNYYEDVAKGLLEGAKEHINNFDKKAIKNGDKIELFEFEYKIIYSPGSFEIPYLINKNKDLYDGFIALGCIIKGETYHFEIISNEVTRKIMDLSIALNKPIGFGILTCETIEQAKERSSSYRNKGIESAKACLDLLING